MSLSDAIREAYADPEADDDIIETLELDHVSFDKPVRIVANSEDDMTLPLGGGAGSDTFVACPVATTLTGYDDDGPTTGQLQIDNISGMLIQPLRDAVQAGYPLKVTYRAYTTADLTEPGEIRAGLLLTSVTLSALSASGTLEPASKADRQAFPRKIYSVELYPALHGTG